jgi:hypothetical protein
MLPLRLTASGRGVRSSTDGSPPECLSLPALRDDDAARLAGEPLTAW